MPLGLEEQLRQDALTSADAAAKAKDKRSLLEAMLSAGSLYEPDTTGLSASMIPEVDEPDEALKRDAMTSVLAAENEATDSSEAAQKRGLAEALMSFVKNKEENDASFSSPVPTRSIPVPMGALMADGGDPGLMNGPSQVRGEREKNAYGNPLMPYTVKSPPLKTLGPTQHRQIAENPYDNLDSTVPAEKSLQDRLAGMTLLHPEAKDVEAKAKAKQQADVTGELELNERQADTANAAKLRSYAPDMNNAMSTSRAEMAALPDDLAERRTSMAKGMEADFLRRNQAPTNPNLWAAMAGTAKGNLIRQAGAARMAGGPSQEQADKEEFEGRKARMADPKQRGKGEFVAMAKASAKPQPWSDAQRENINLSRDKMAEDDAAAKQARNDAMSGVAPADDASPRYMKVYQNTLGQLQRQVGPTLFAALRRPDVMQAMFPNANQQGRGQQVGTSDANMDERSKMLGFHTASEKRWRDESEAKKKAGDAAGSQTAMEMAEVSKRERERLEARQAPSGPPSQPKGASLASRVAGKKPNPAAMKPAVPALSFVQQVAPGTMTVTDLKAAIAAKKQELDAYPGRGKDRTSQSGYLKIWKELKALQDALK